MSLQRFNGSAWEAWAPPPTSGGAFTFAKVYSGTLAATLPAGPTQNNDLLPLVHVSDVSAANGDALFYIYDFTCSFNASEPAGNYFGAGGSGNTATTYTWDNHPTRAIITGVIVKNATTASWELVWGDRATLSYPVQITGTLDVYRLDGIVIPNT